MHSPAVIAGPDAFEEFIKRTNVGNKDPAELVKKYADPVFFGIRQGHASCAAFPGGVGSIQYQHDGTRLCALVKLSCLEFAYDSSNVQDMFERFEHW